MDMQVLPLAHPDVQAAKKLYEEWPSRQRKPLGFETLLERFSQEDFRTSDLAEEMGISGESVRLMYERFFRKLCGGLALHERHAIVSQRRRLVRIGARDLAPEFFSAHRGARVVEVARRMGYGVSADRQHSGSLNINGIWCLLRRANSTFSSKDYPNLKYFHFVLARTHLTEAEVVIFHCNAEGHPERIFIVPSRVLKSLFGRRDGKYAQKALYLPVKKVPVYNNILPSIDYWPYENAWHLLRE